MEGVGVGGGDGELPSLADTIAAVRRELSLSAIYFQTGVVLAMWAVCIPQVRADLNISPAVLGTLLLMLGAGLFAGIQLRGPVLDRLGSRQICGVRVAVFAEAINLPGIASEPVSLAIALFALGLTVSRRPRCYGYPLTR